MSERGELTWADAPDEDEAAQGVVDDFRAAFDAGPDGVWAAPGRVNLIGEHLDYNGGPALPFALPHTTLAAVRLRDDDRVRATSRAALGDEASSWEGRLADVGAAGSPQEVRGWPSYVAGVAWALARAGHDVPGFDVALTSAVPIGAGLSSSAAVEGGVALALAEHLGLPLDDAGRAQLAAACVRAENEVAGAPTGGMDQAASLRSRAGHALLLESADGSVRHLPFDAAAAGASLLVIDTRTTHRHADGQYAQRRAACERAAEQLGVTALAELTDLEAALARLTGDHGGAAGQGTGDDTAVLRRRVRHVVTETSRTREAAGLLAARGDRLGAADLTALGALLDASHDSLRDDYEVSCPELDTAVDAARAAGAWGARMTGGGFGGSAVALVAADGVEAVAGAVRAAALAAGHPEPVFLAAVPSAGARRLR